MADEILNNMQRDSRLKGDRDEGVPERVWGEALVDASGSGEPSYRARSVVSVQATAVVGEKQRTLLPPVHVLLDGRARTGREGDNGASVALPGYRQHAVPALL